MTMKKGITEILSDYFCNLNYDDLPAEVVQQAKKIILDAVGCQVACTQLENGQMILEFGRGEVGAPEASILGSNIKTSAMNAALINGALGHGDEIDESLEDVGHTSAVIVSTALACGEKVGAGGKDMIAAVVSGYDMAGRLIDAGAGARKLGIEYRMGLTGVFWGVAAATNILKLSPEKTMIAFGLASCQAMGYYDFGSESKHMAKSLIMGLGARGGVTAALLAKMGYDGPRSIFDEGRNLFKPFIGEAFDATELTKDLGKKFTIMDTCIKLYSAGHPIHAPVDGLLKIMEQEHIGAEDIKSITVRQPYTEQKIVDNRDMLDINIQYCLAVAAFDRQLTWDQFTPQRVKDPKVAELKKRVTSVFDPQLDERKKITKAHSAELELETKGLVRVLFPVVGR